MLEIPLAAKLFAANLVIAGVALLLMFGPSRLQPERLIDGYIVVAALTLGATVSVLMVRVDPRLTRLSNTNNEMLERLTTSRKEMERLRAEVVYAAERERFNVAQELHDSVGQRLADVSFQIAEAANSSRNVVTSSRLENARKLLRGAINEIRGISRTAHPHVAADAESPGAFDELNEKSRRGSAADMQPSVSIARLLVPDRYSELSRSDIRDIGLGIHRTRER